MSEPIGENTVFDPIALRRNEIDQYQNNINMYQSMIANLPSEYPPHLEKYRGVPANQQHQTINEIDDIDDVVLLSDLWLRDQCVHAVKTETLEMRKAKAILDAML